MLSPTPAVAASSASVSAPAAPGEPPAARRAYAGIGDYAAIGDCRSAALVARDGSIDWLCWPEFSSPAMFAALLDRGRGGRYQVTVADLREVERRYRPGTNVLETTLRSAAGAVRLCDALVIGGAEGLAPQRELLRTVDCLDGAPELVVRYAPRPDFARRATRLDVHGGSVVLRDARNELLVLRAALDFTLTPDRRAASARRRLRAGERHRLALAYTHRDVGVLPELGEAADARLERTAEWWRAWSARCASDLPFAAAVQRSALVLKMLAHALSGAIVAAPTSSLPEAVGGSRNWDYRYCWLRDASLTLRAFSDLGYFTEAAAFLNWLLHTTGLTRPKLRAVYDAYGNPTLEEKPLRELEGYRRSRPVRVGNRAHAQLQLDVYGSVCAAAAEFANAGGTLDFFAKRALARFGVQVAKSWREPDNGIWERQRKRQNTYSKLMCWTALDRLLALDDSIGLPVDRDRLETERAAIRRWIESETWNGGVRSFVAEPGTDAPDASLLALARTGFLDARDERMAATFAYLERRLGAGPLLYRYVPGSDDLPGREGAFGIASFWAVEYLARAGRVAEAEQRFGRLLAYANDVGLLAEEVDARTGEALGNFPQAFTHVGLITAAVELRRAARGDR